MLIVVAFAACQPQRTADQVNVEINKTRNQIAKLNQQLTELEAELATLDTGSAEQGTRVVVAPVSAGTFTDFIQLSGMVEAVKSAAIMPEMGGKVMKIHVREGQFVAKGDKLVSLDSEVMQNSLAELEKGYELALTMYNSQKNLWDQGVGSEMQYIQTKNQKESLERTMETLKSQLAMSEITAPFDGRVEKIYLKAGESASMGRPVLDLVNLGQLYVNTEVSESYIQSVHRGDTAWLEFPNLPGVTKTVPVSFVSQVINPQSRTFSIRVEINNPKGEIKPNMLANLKLRVLELSEIITVPTILVRHDFEGEFIYLAKEKEGKYFATKSYVSTGHSDGERSVVTDGLMAGDWLVVKGYNQIKEGTLLEIIQE